jgi:hypothetical protein
VELVAVVVGGALRVGLASVTVGLKSRGSRNAEMELIAVVISSAVCVSGAVNAIALNRFLGSRSPWDAEVELIAVMVRSALGVSLASVTVSLESGSPWDAEVELVAVVVGSAVGIGGAVNAVSLDGLSGAGNTETELIALVPGRADTSLAAFAGAVGGRLELGIGAGNTEAELIAFVASGANASLATLASSIRNG